VASARGLPAVGTLTTRPCHRSPVLSVAVSSVVRLAKHPGVRSAAYHHGLATPALSRFMYGACFRQHVHDMGIEEVFIVPRSPWQNPSVERLIGVSAARAWTTSWSCMSDICGGC
jgi:hypothetical protein